MKMALRKIFLHSYEKCFFVYYVSCSIFKKEQKLCSVKMLEIIPRKKKKIKIWNLKLVLSSYKNVWISNPTVP